MSDLSLSQLVWISIKPLIKVLLPTAVGAAMVRYRKLDQDGLKAAAHIQIYGALPCLMFSNVVPSITAQNSPRILVCVGFGLLYMLMSYLLSKALLMVVPVPNNFRNGFIVAAVWSNWGNIPMSVIQSLTGGPPFGKPEDVEMGVSYASFFVMVYNVMMFVGPGTKMIDRDYMKTEEAAITTPYLPYNPTVNQTERPSIDDQPGQNGEANRPTREAFPEAEIRADQQFSSPQSRGQKGVLSGLLNNLSPVIVSLLFGTLVAVTPPLKGLFTKLKDHAVQEPSAPDGKPLLSVILDSTEYLGAAAIPLGLLVTGASFANMSIPRRSWFRLPLRAIFGLTLIKLVCLPALGIVAVSFIDGYTNFFAGEEGRVLKLISLYYSCTVTSTNQISLSSIAAGIFLKPGESSDEEVASNVDLLCSFVALQYLIYPFVGTFFIGLIVKMVS
ncbi:Protein M3 [Puccinia graminis f. sp. tritici]|uniref:Protein M3 n=1 Tax=Puccinia graminis f. sp. tritici TaxID=56615 RepID=A0A5B0M372_PUCGR|nr:Protein M3 [Puccinia graminis f. sp. tritici]KAA1089980.1 Protein M3 [Puccinia graminis f. sp. tritici]